MPLLTWAGWLLGPTVAATGWIAALGGIAPLLHLHIENAVLSQPIDQWMTYINLPIAVWLLRRYPLRSLGCARNKKWMFLASIAYLVVWLYVLPEPELGQQWQGPVIWAFPAIAIAGPIWEEMMFRGWLWEALEGRYSAWVAMLSSFSIFTLLHPVYHDWQLAALYVAFHVLLTFVRQVTGSIRPTILLHMLNNANVFIQ